MVVKFITIVINFLLACVCVCVGRGVIITLGIGILKERHFLMLFLSNFVMVKNKQCILMFFIISSRGNFICPFHQRLLLLFRYFLAIFFSLLMLILMILTDWLVDLRLADVKHTLTN